MGKTLLKIENLKEYYPVRKGFFGKTGYVKALDGVSFEVNDGEVFGIVGESGCGKSTLGLAITKLIEPTGGQIILNGEDITHFNAQRMRPIRRQMQMVFQDPYASLNPRMSVRDIIKEPMIIHHLASSQKEMNERVVELLRQVGLDDYHANRYPHQFSGGQRQRIMLMIAALLQKDIVLLDEPTSALDPDSIARVIDYIRSLHEATVLMVSHDARFIDSFDRKIYIGD